MREFFLQSKKAFASAAGAAAASAGIVLAELDIRAVVGAGVVAFVTTWFAPKNKEVKNTGGVASENL
jgi:hypothetical protein